MDPTAELCDTLVVSDNLGRISAEEEERLRIEELEKKEQDRIAGIKWKLERSIREPRLKTSYSIAELKTLAGEMQVDVKPFTLISLSVSLIKCNKL